MKSYKSLLFDGKRTVLHQSIVMENMEGVENYFSPEYQYTKLISPNLEKYWK